MTLCIHCRRNQPGHGNRGLCRRCWDQPAVRGLYPPIKYSRPDREPEPTEAELEATIAEQSRALPDWWSSECRKIQAHGAH